MAEQVPGEEAAKRTSATLPRSAGRPSKEGLPPGWYKGLDPTYKRPYYFNKKTRRSTWTRPASEGPLLTLSNKAKLDEDAAPEQQQPEQDQTGKSSKRAASITPGPERDPPKVPPSSYEEKRGKPTRKPRAVWIEVYSPEHRRTYFFNRHTKESRWTKPPELLEADRVLQTSEHAHPPSSDGADCDRTSSSSSSATTPSAEVPALRTAWGEIEEARRQLQREREEHMVRLKSEWKVLQSQIQELRELTLQSSFAPAAHIADSMGSPPAPMGSSGDDNGADSPLNIAPAPADGDLAGSASASASASSSTPATASASAPASDGPMGFVMVGPTAESGDADANPAAPSSQTPGVVGSKEASFNESLTPENDGMGANGAGSYTAGLLSELEEYADSLMERRQSIHRMQERARALSEDTDFDKEAYINEVLQSLGGPNGADEASFQSRPRPGAAVRENGANTDSVIPYGNIEEEEKDVDEQLRAVQAEAEAVARAQKQVRELEEGCYYKLLEVEPEVSAAQLKKAYHRAMMKYHPDKFKGNDAERDAAQKKSAQIGQAYQCLSDPWERKLYDRMGLQQYQVHASVVQSFINFIVSGTAIRKHPHSRKPYGWKFIDRQFVHRRMFWLSTDHEWLHIAKKRNLEPSEAELENMKRIKIQDVTKVTKGMQTGALLATGSLRKEHKYLSILTADRSYDLEAPDQRQREFLHSRLTLLVIHLQKNEEWFERFHAERNPKKKKGARRKRPKHHKSMGAPPTARKSSSASQTSVGELKQRIRDECDSRLVVEAQRLLLKAKERPDATKLHDVLSAAERKKLEQGADVTIKGMIMLTERFTHVLDTPLPSSELDAEDNDDEQDEAGDDDDDDADQGAQEEETIDVSQLDAGAVLVNVQQGKRVFQVVAPHEEWTIEEIKLNLQSRLGVPVAQQRLLVKSKVRANESTLRDCGLTAPGPGKAMLLFSAGFHIAEDGAAYLAIADEELQRAQSLMSKLQKQLSHRLADATELSLELAAAIDRLQNVQHNLDRPVPMREKERKASVLAGIAETIEKLQNIKRYGARKQK
ncbi:DnaJ family protein [Hondaea fermentalgiana]|uniref:DnaJ family protein n=1 Tax=Hondaea fermentalgiana TaxID=2315210 RepID=A0A2R5GV24_9STRA|nr:DnaJ family protein [Hondaea fermentalgiana]|eukprot:GBG34415.1 DnaJ family protein [Hondaea fermentalgiana]